jgi:hypothetical protein
MFSNCVRDNKALGVAVLGCSRKPPGKSAAEALIGLSKIENNNASEKNRDFTGCRLVIYCYSLKIYR